jgi:hypothetical protein
MTGVEIVAPCPVCECVVLRPSEIQLLVSSNPALSHYGFTCPICASVITRPATSDTIHALLRGGVVAVLHQVPAEALEPHTGPVISPDDVLDFALAPIDLTELVSA